ncbi:MAG: DUF4430 domain-containing protein [Patescibacteria group bacterium]|jgi:hypothetical protein
MRKTNILVLVLVVALAGVLLVNSNKKNENANQAQTNTNQGQVLGASDEKVNSKLVSYVGEDGKTAYELLKKNATVEAQESTAGAFVQSINNVKNTDKEFWIFYVNGEMSNSASDKYITKVGDKIEWRYQGF